MILHRSAFKETQGLDTERQLQQKRYIHVLKQANELQHF